MINNMEKVYKIIKDCKFANKGRVFENAEDYDDMVVYTSTEEHDNGYSTITLDEETLDS